LIEITVPQRIEAATYEIRQLDDDPGSNPFEITEALRKRIFSLGGELNHFQGQDLDVHRKIANLAKDLSLAARRNRYETEIQLHTNARRPSCCRF